MSKSALGEARTMEIMVTNLVRVSGGTVTLARQMEKGADK